ncbi:MAG: dolichol kinase [Ignavibacteriales bacterium]|nr:dolichol kinase [Ignavibacteriales bacterium]
MPSGAPPDAQASETLEQKATIDYKSELVRKGIHLCSLSIPVIYYFISQRLALSILIPLSLAFLITDIARHFHQGVARWYSRWFGWLLRQHEQDSSSRRLNGATNILLSAVVCVAVFPKIITVNAFAILIVSDTTSALYGRRFGKRRFLNKSLEGTLAFFISALAVIFVAPKVLGTSPEFGLWIAAAAAGAIAEAWSPGVDDNISVPLTIGLVAWGLYGLFLPGANLFFLS